jgi:acetyl-CoA carboxylase carboxyltransferase component
MDPNACDKITSFLVFCDSFNIPIIILVDTPGFLIGVEGEKQKAPGKIMNFMTALQLCSVPKISVILRKSYGQAYLNMGGGSNSDLVIAWPFAEVSFISPELGVWVVNNKKIQDNDPNYNNYLKKMTYDNSALELARSFGIQDIIDPRNTRQYLINALETLDKKIAKHNMSNWPTTF